MSGGEEQPHHLVRMNPEQYRAVTAIEGPVLVLAGAGSGKTRVLTRRIAHLLHCGRLPTQILAVTFTNKAATEMKERVAELIGEAAEKIWVSTFHSTCARILRSDIEPLGYTRRFAIYDDDDQLRLLKQIIANAGYDPTRIDAREIASRIDGYKNRMLGPDQILDERRSHIGDPLIRVWREYDEAMLAADALDFNDLIGKVVTLFEREPEILEKWRERFQYVMVDEYQDTNRGQYQLLQLLCKNHRNLAVVGDDDQSIYGFRGAEISNILNFQKDYPEAEIVRLEQNYRSTANILALANAVVSHNTGRLEKRLWTESPGGAKIQMIVSQGPREEGVRVAEAIHKLRRMGVPLSDIAIIYRTNAIGRFFEAGLQGARIPHKVVGGKKFYERREVRDILAYLRLLVNPADDAAFLRVVNVPPRGVGAKTQSELRTDAANRGQPLLSSARTRGLGRTAGEKGLGSFVQLIDGLTETARDVPLGELVQQIIERSGYRAMLQSDTTVQKASRKGEKEAEKPPVITKDAEERLKSLKSLVEDAAAFASPPGVLGRIEHLTSWLDRIALSSESEEAPEGGEVTLMTVHSSKGLEFPVVFVVQMNEGAFPHERSLDTGVEEERRLAYVAFTRAMTRLVVTRSVRDAQNQPSTPSRFLYGIPTEVLEGDLPEGDPTIGDREQRAVDAEEVSSKLNRFLAHRRDRLARSRQEEEEDELPAPEGQYTLIEIESAEQLVPGVQILDPRYGVGRIRHVVDGQLRVAFDETLRSIRYSPALRIVAE